MESENLTNKSEDENSAKVEKTVNDAKATNEPPNRDNLVKTSSNK